MIEVVNGVNVTMTQAEEAAFEASRAPAPPGAADCQAAIQKLIDGTAVSKEYADGVTLASYANSTVFDWHAQALAFIAWRDDVWTYAYAQLALVSSGQRTQPTIENFLAELPAISWPTV